MSTMPNQTSKSARQEVILLSTRLPRRCDMGPVIDAFRASSLSARISTKRESDYLLSPETGKLTYEDSQLTCGPLLPPSLLSFPGIDVTAIGQLLNVGRTVELLQNFRPGVKRKYRYDLDFLISSLCMEDGNSGGYLALLDWFVWAFHELGYSRDIRYFSVFKKKSQAAEEEESAETSDLLSAELFRQFLDHFHGKRMLPWHSLIGELVNKMKATDVSEFTTEERTNILIAAHMTLVEKTNFVDQYTQKYCLRRTQQKRLVEDLDARLLFQQQALQEKNAEPRLEDSPPDPDREAFLAECAAKICALSAEATLARSAIMRSNREFDNAMRPRCLGCDRNFDRYWHFPELSSGVFVESGWCNPPDVKASKLAGLLRYDKPTDPLASPVVANFVFPAEQTGVHLISQDGTHRPCDSSSISPSPVEQKWSFYHLDQLKDLVPSLNSFGIRESELKRKIKSILKDPPESRTQPIVTEAVLEALKQYLAKFMEELSEEHFFFKPLDENWQDKLESATLTQVKRMMLSTFLNISGPLLNHRETLPDDASWEEVIMSTDSLSRLYYLCTVVYLSVKWDRGLAEEGCKFCKKDIRHKQLRRCNACNSVVHADFCTTFFGGKCRDCTGGRELRTGRAKMVSYKEMDEEDDRRSGISKRSQLQRDENWTPSDDERSNKRRRGGSEGSESVQEEETKRIVTHGYALRRGGNRGSLEYEEPISVRDSDSVQDV